MMGKKHCCMSSTLQTEHTIEHITDIQIHNNKKILDRAQHKGRPMPVCGVNLRVWNSIPDNAKRSRGEH